MEFERHGDRDQASRQATEYLRAALAKDIAIRGEATLIGSGGTTPIECYRKLADTAVDWSRVTVTLSDERWVDPSDPASNEAMLRRELLHGPAAAARFTPLYRPVQTPDEALADVTRELDHLTRPFSAVLLGMGNDGHFASLFPDAARLSELLDPVGAEVCASVRTSASPVPRISLTLSALLNTHRIHLLIFGDDKRAVLEKAAANRDAELPITALLHQTETPVHVLFAP